MKNAKQLILSIGSLCIAVGSLLGQVTNNNANITAIYGSGNSEQAWTLTTFQDQASGFELQLALRAKTRFVGPIIPDGNVYTTQTGLSQINNPSNTASVWNFDFHIGVFGAGNQVLSPLYNYSYSLSLDFDSSPSTQFLIDDPTLAYENYFGEVATPQGGGRADVFALPEETILQNSQNYGFIPQDYLGSGFSFDPFQQGTYTIRLEAFDLFPQSSAPIAAVEIEVVAVPEPSTMALLGAGTAVCLLWLRRRHRKG